MRLIHDSRFVDFERACYDAGWLGGVDSILLLRRRAVRLHGLYEKDCNGYSDWRGNWDEKAEVAGELAEDRLEGTIAALVSENLPGYSVYFQGDPRGWPVYLLPPGANENNYNSEGIGVYIG